MHDNFSCATPQPDASEAVDLLSHVLLGLRLEGVEYGRCVLQRPWAVAFPAQRDARFHFIALGGAWLKMPDAHWQRLNAGDAVLVPRGTAHVMASAPDVQAVEIGTLPHTPISDNIYLVRDQNIAQPQLISRSTVMFCGSMRFNLDPLHPLLAMMPELMHAGELAERDPAVPTLLDAMEREVSLDRIGACGILARLADVLAASIIRAWVECSRNTSTGWIAAVQCPKVGKVIAAIHAAPERNWSVPTLASLMGVSRSRFADAFSHVMGESPARYVAKVKMFQARHWIQHQGMRVTVAAERLGYDSEASFSRAFKRIIGVPPSAVRSQ